MFLIVVISAVSLLSGGWIHDQHIFLLAFASTKEVALWLDLEVLE